MADNSFKVKNSIVIQGIELDLSGATPNQALVFNGTKFAPAPPIIGPTGPAGPDRLQVSDTAPSSPSEGDLWFNSNQGRLFSYYDDFWIEISGPIGPTGPSPLTAADTAPSSPSPGDLWFDSSEAKLYSYLDSYWIEISGEAGPTGPTGPAQLANVSESQPSDPQTGQLWYNTSSGTLNVYDGSSWNAV